MIPYPRFVPASGRVGWKGLTAEQLRDLAAQGRLIGANDLWIAANAPAHDFGVVTNNRDESGRVPGSSF